MPFGKYKDTQISKITDLEYLDWVLANMKLKGSLLVTIQERIKALR